MTWHDRQCGMHQRRAGRVVLPEDREKDPSRCLETVVRLAMLGGLETRGRPLGARRTEAHDGCRLRRVDVHSTLSHSSFLSLSGCVSPNPSYMLPESQDRPISQLLHTQYVPLNVMEELQLSGAAQTQCGETKANAVDAHLNHCLLYR